MKKGKLLILPMLILSLLVGCGTTTGEDEQDKSEVPAGENLEVEQEFVFGGSNDMLTLDVSQMNEEMSALVLYAVNEGLLRYSDDQVINGIAEDYTVSDDGTVYTFKLRDALWSDGEPVTAHDFEYSFFRTLNPATGSSQVTEFDNILNAKDFYNGELTDKSKVGIKAIDDKTLEITLEKNDPFFVLQLAQGINFYPIREDYVEKYGESYGSGKDSFIGCGPFNLSDWTQASSIVMEKNNNYWDAENVKLDKVTQLIIPDENTLAGMYDLGEIDAIYSISTAQTELYPEHGSKSGGSLQFLSYNTRDKSVLANENLRKALSFAIDRQAVVHAVAAPGTEVADSMIDPNIMLDGKSITEEYPNSTGVPVTGDIDKAKEYLEVALNELGLSSADQLPAIKYVAMETTAHRQYAEVLQAKWKEALGVNVELSLLPVPQAIGALIGGEFDIFLVSLSTGSNPDILLKNFTIDNGNNYSGWENQEYSDLISKAGFSKDVDEMLSCLQQAEEIILEEVPVMPLWLPGSAYLVRDNVKGVHFGVQTGSIEFNHAYIVGE